MKKNIREFNTLGKVHLSFKWQSPLNVGGHPVNMELTLWPNKSDNEKAPAFTSREGAAVWVYVEEEKVHPNEQKAGALF